MLLLFALALLVSAVDRLIGAGLLPALVDPVWNSAWLLDDGHGLGSVLAAMVGYRARPSLTLLLVFAVYAATVLRAMRTARRHA
jgi:high-affinity iron transporter